MKSDILHTKKYYSIRNIIIITNTIVVLFFMLLTIILFSQTYGRIVLKRYEDKQVQMVSYLLNSFNETISGVNQLASATAQNIYIIEQLTEYDEKKGKDKNIVFLNNMSASLQVVANARPDIVSVNILTDRVNMNNSKVNGVYNYKDYFKNNLIEKMMDQVDFWLPTRNNDIELTIYQNQIISYCKKIYTNLYNGYPIGHLIINFKEDLFYKVIKDFKDGEDYAKIILADNEGTVLTSNDRTLPGLNIKDTEYEDIFNSADEFDKGSSIIKDGNIIAAGRMRKQNWKLIAISDYKAVMRPVLDLNEKIFIFSMIIIIAFVLLCSLISFFITNPIVKFARYVDYGYDKSGSNVGKEDSGLLEVHILYRRFDHMKKQIDQLIKNLYLEEKMKRRAEMEALQAQINPHFLYNTLESINWMAQIANQNKISRMVVLLGDFLRLSLNQGKIIYKIKDELIHLKSYIEIQSIRYGGKIVYKEDVDESLKDLYIIKLLLQPIVENSILHGFESTQGSGTISLKAESGGNTVSFIISDDGCGMTQETIDSLKKGDTGKGYGLMNVDKRIKMYYGEDYGISIKSLPGEGTTIIVRISKTINYGDE